MKNSFSKSYIKNLLGNNAHVEIAKGTHQQCISYYSKSSSRVDGPWTYGVPTVSGSNKRELVERYRRSPQRLMLEEPSKYRRVEAYIKNLRFCDTPHTDMLDREWQKSLQTLLSQPPNRRTIYWVYGPIGNDGKTSFAMKLAKEGWYYTKGGKKDNVIYQYVSNIDRNVVMDIPRESREYMQYDILEMLKDRTLISNKYEPITILSDQPVHVVVMANFEPDYNRISKDRIFLINV